jgi:predicted TIM-barrel fold metal-dependent hydrolase
MHITTYGKSSIQVANRASHATLRSDTGRHCRDRACAGRDDLRRDVDHLLETFGPDRLMWDSDWPVVNLAGGYIRWRDASAGLLAGIPQRDRDAVFGGTALKFYGLMGY